MAFQVLIGSYYGVTDDCKVVAMVFQVVALVLPGYSWIVTRWFLSYFRWLIRCCLVVARVLLGSYYVTAGCW